MADTLTIPIGTGVWSLSRENAEGQPLGGVVVDIVEKPDPETGEVSTQVVCVNPYRSRLVVEYLDVADIAPFTDSPTELKSWAIIRKLAHSLAIDDAHKNRTGYVTRTEQRWLRWAWRLATEGAPT